MNVSFSDRTFLSLIKGSSKSLTDLVNSNESHITWTSTNTDVATVINGIVTGISVGTTHIYAKTSTGKVSFFIIDIINPITAIEFDNVSFVMNKGSSKFLEFTPRFLPEDTSDSKIIKWKSSNENVIWINSNTLNLGVIHARNIGTSTITAITSNGKTATFIFTVIDPIRSIELNKEEISLIVGEWCVIYEKIVPINTTDDPTISWTSNDEEIATVEKGIIRAISPGTTIIKATTSTGLYSTCKVIVYN